MAIPERAAILVLALLASVACRQGGDSRDVGARMAVLAKVCHLETAALEGLVQNLVRFASDPSREPDTQTRAETAHLGWPAGEGNPRHLPGFTYAMIQVPGDDFSSLKELLLVTEALGKQAIRTAAQPLQVIIADPTITAQADKKAGFGFPVAPQTRVEAPLELFRFRGGLVWLSEPFPLIKLDRSVIYEPMLERIDAAGYSVVFPAFVRVVDWKPLADSVGATQVQYVFPVRSIER
jgi:hypothetical protein